MSVDPVESEPPYVYVRGNVVNWTDASGKFPEWLLKTAYGEHTVNVWKKQDEWWWNRMLEAEHGDVLISWDKKQIAQFVLDDPLIVSRWEGECYRPITTITLEGFERDGRYWSSDSFSNAEVWRKNTGSFYYTGLHPNDPTWGQFVSPSLLPYMADHQRFMFGVYYWANLQTRASHVFQHVATMLDVVATLQSAQTTAAIDTTGLLLIGFGCAGGAEGCAAGAGAAWEVDQFGSKITSWYDVRYGIGSLGMTALSDWVGGYTTVANGRTRIGEATVHTSITFAEGWVPESNFILYTNIKQLLYDFGVDRVLDFGAYDVKAIEVD